MYTAMLELYQNGEPIDVVTVATRLRAMGRLRDCPMAYLCEILNTAPQLPPAEEALWIAETIDALTPGQSRDRPTTRKMEDEP